MNRYLGCLWIALIFLAGCTTTRTSDTSRTGMEQILISNAVDQTLDRLELPPVSNRKVFLDPQYLETAVDKGYVISSLRRRLLNAGANLADKKEDSELTIEICSGCVGTDNSSTFFGVPGIAVPGIMPVQLPEVRFYERGSQFGTAKLSLVAYETKSGQLIHDSGRAVARSDDSRWSLMGVGPFYSGSARNEVNMAGSSQNYLQRTAAVEDDVKVR